MELYGQNENQMERGMSTSSQPPNTPQDFEQFVIQKIGFDPYNLNPVAEAINHFSKNESSYFQQVFRDKSPQELTPDMLKYWNEQKKNAIETIASSLEAQRQQGVAKLKVMMDLKKDYDERREITGTQTLNQQGQKVYATRSGEPSNTIVPPAAPSEQERKDIKQEMTILKMTDDIQKLFKNDYVGPIAGRYGQLAEKFENLPADQVKFYSTIRDINDFVLRVRSGAQINEQEYKRLTSFLMDANLPPDNFKARLERFSENIDWILGLERRMGEMSNKTTRQSITPPSAKATENTGNKTIVKQQKNKRTGQIRTIYSDGTEDIK